MPEPPPAKPSLQSFPIQRLQKGRPVEMIDDLLAVEAPLEMTLRAAGQKRRGLAVTMRTPGQDEELALGFLFTEGIIGGRRDVVSISANNGPEEGGHRIHLELAKEVPFAWEEFRRHFYANSSCGLCGKASLDMVRGVAPYFPRKAWPMVAAEVLCRLPEKLRAAQPLFSATGGIHAAAAFSPTGDLLWLCEDVGRHNAMDKLIGSALLAGALPLREQIVLVSGRLSFELVQKAAMAGVPVLAAVGAPSSLAVELAAEHGMTLVGFLGEGRCNLYTGAERLREFPADKSPPSLKKT